MTEQPLGTVVFAAMLLLSGCDASRSTTMLREAAASSNIGSVEAVEFKGHVRSTNLYLRADRSGDIIHIYKVSLPNQSREAVPVYFSRAAYDAELGGLGPPQIIRGDEVLRLTSGLGIVFNLGGDPTLIWASDYADDVRSEWADSPRR